ncbi:hypothetical protein GGX14DRAFT_600482 [Mycena pura]|uniref:Uncharacterized protein n=1 Tax=Mycena pura TaxID=153505 RepID=A0AAD6UNQ2_9AGAR|nr:hypothetical protein GGX14DRAFT_600482 [Mycena pura]
MSPTPLRFAHYASPAPSSRSRLQAPCYPREGLSKPPRCPKPFASILKPSVSSVKPSASSSKSSPPPQALPLPKSSASSPEPSASPRLASLRHHKVLKLAQDPAASREHWMLLHHLVIPSRELLHAVRHRCRDQMPAHVARLTRRPDSLAARVSVACGPSPLGAPAPCSLELPHAPPPTPSPRGSVWRATLPWTRSCPRPPRSSCVRMSSMHRGDGATVPLLERSAPTAVRARVANDAGRGRSALNSHSALEREKIPIPLAVPIPNRVLLMESDLSAQNMEAVFEWEEKQTIPNFATDEHTSSGGLSAITSGP